jgi:transcriptional regulator with XRE-family HTH domain
MAERRKAMGLSQEALAELIGVDRSTVVRWERGERRPQPWHRRKLASALSVSADELAALLANEPPTVEVEEMDRRTALPAMGLPVVGAIIELLTPVGERVAAAPQPVHARDLVVQAKKLYQECHYIRALSSAQEFLVGYGHSDVVAADAYHVVASVMLKLGDGAMGTLAAQRSMDAAGASGDVVAIACSTRIMVHALMSTGHAERAITLASSVTASLRKTSEAATAAGLSALGALNLRAAIAAARMENRAAAWELLAEAERAAAVRGRDANDRWTGFGPTNVEQHKVHIAVTLGDCGLAIERAKSIDLRTITLAERRASLLVDMTQAYLRWGRVGQALEALEHAHHIAPEEIARDSGRRLCADLVSAARGPMRDKALRFATRVGMGHVI